MNPHAEEELKESYEGKFWKFLRKYFLGEF
jgi:hypothetical protein